MTNQAILAVLNHVDNEARDFTHAALGIMDAFEERGSLAELPLPGPPSTDALLCVIDDLRELLSDRDPEACAAEEFDLALCTGETAEVLSLAAARRGRGFQINAPAEVLSIGQDRRAVEWILTRVLDTALKLSHAGDAVRLDLVRSGPGAKIVLSGEDAEIATRLGGWLNLLPDQMDPQTPEDVRLGIAVMLAGKRLRALGGSTALAREPGGRSSVTLHFPSRQDAGQPEPAGDSHLPRLNVLVAEDCDESYFLTESMLPEEKIWRAHDGQEALAAVQRRRFDVVFMDVHMPGMNGYEAIRNIREWETLSGNARTPVVVLSSDSLETQRREAASSGCSGFLRKPLRRSSLEDVLRWLKQARMQSI